MLNLFDKSDKVAANGKSYTYAELKRMTKGRVIRLAGFKNFKDMMNQGYFDNPSQASKKAIARTIASDC